MKQHQKLLTLVEGALCIAIAYALSFIKFKIWPEGGSIDIVMVPLLIYAWRRGAGWGIIAGLIFGTIKCFFAGGFAWGRARVSERGVPAPQGKGDSFGFEQDFR